MPYQPWLYKYTILINTVYIYCINTDLYMVYPDQTVDVGLSTYILSPQIVHIKHINPDFLHLSY